MQRCNDAVSICSWWYGLIFLAWCGASVTFTGCGNSGETWVKVTVEGAATLDGKKVISGDIRFVPTAASMGPTVGAKIVDGHYRVTNKGGVPVGTHRIVLRAFNVDGVGPASGGLSGGDLFGGDEKPKPARRRKPSLPTYMVEGYPQYLPPAYNSVTAVRVDITGQDNPQVEDFDMAIQEPKK